MDVSLEAEVIALFKGIDARFDSVMALVNNVGPMEGQIWVMGTDNVRMQSVCSNNITSCFLCSPEAVRRMFTEHGGKAEQS
ncbi:SDR family NAD(P)-dependent oxidoreductase [Adhaeribacter aquaticus]|uniref:SDR family NAD(P)-dependent oxidoreductase n=1 Tax=Adhaeribacter aquaticus TaxID=299567 RepID=UPI0004191FF2|nr:SDR family NAD(P)-dependent oxidoreductase [Adhaeribacter aquaticus]